MKISEKKMEKLVEIYEEYIQEAFNIQDISRWVTKKSITNAVLTGERANETKVMDAIGDRQVQEGDKVWLFSDIDGMKQAVVKGELQYKKDGEPKMVENRILRLEEDWTGGYDKAHYLGRVYKTIKILENVINMEQFVKYYTKAGMKKLEER